MTRSLVVTTTIFTTRQAGGVRLGAGGESPTVPVTRSVSDRMRSNSTKSVRTKTVLSLSVVTAPYTRLTVPVWRAGGAGTDSVLNLGNAVTGNLTVRRMGAMRAEKTIWAVTCILMTPGIVISLFEEKDMSRVQLTRVFVSQSQPIFLIERAAVNVRRTNGDVTAEPVLTGPNSATALKINIVETAVTRVLRIMKAAISSLKTRGPAASLSEERDT